MTTRKNKKKRTKNIPQSDELFLSPAAPENLVRRLVHPVPRQPVHYSRTPLFLPTSRDGARLYRQPPSVQSRDYEVAQLRTDGVHRRTSTCTKPVVIVIVIVLKVARVTSECSEVHWSISPVPRRKLRRKPLRTTPPTPRTPQCGGGARRECRGKWVAPQCTTHSTLVKIKNELFF